MHLYRDNEKDLSLMFYGFMNCAEKLHKAQTQVTSTSTSKNTDGEIFIAAISITYTHVKLEFFNKTTVMNEKLKI